jgi:hypothetical protein
MQALGFHIPDDVPMIVSLGLVAAYLGLREIKSFTRTEKYEIKALIEAAGKCEAFYQTSVPAARNE